VSGGAQGSHGDRTQSGQGLVEYGLILVIAAVACVVSLVFFGDQLSSLFSLIASAV
jgi:Flp pilus assembly pilin Flp